MFEELLIMYCLVVWKRLLISSCNVVIDEHVVVALRLFETIINDYFDLC